MTTPTLKAKWRDWCNTDNLSDPPSEIDRIADFFISSFSAEIDGMMKKHIHSWDDRNCGLVENGEDCDVCSHNAALDELKKRLGSIER